MNLKERKNIFPYWGSYQRVLNQLIEYEQCPGSQLLFQGEYGLPMYEDALQLCAELLCTTVKHLPYHPDFLLVDVPEEKKSIGVDECSTIGRVVNVIPSLGEYIVILIHQINKMTTEAQNRLLKLLEDNTHVIIIGVSYYDCLLPTIKSRMRKITYHTMNEEEFFHYCSDKDLPHAYSQALFYAGGGCPETEDLKEVCDIFLQVKTCILKNDYSSLYGVLGLVAEKKDTLSFFKNYPKYTRNLLHFMAAVYHSMLEDSNYILDYILQQLQVIHSHLGICHLGAYTQDSFLLAIAELHMNEKRR